MDLVDLGARSKFLADLEFTEMGHLAGKNLERISFLGPRAAWSFAKHPLNAFDI